ncbi:MAG: response regulator transcription factor [Bacteroidota bacterium]
MKSHTILIADDEKDILELLEYNLNREGYLVLKARNGQEALQLAKEHQPNLILLDIGMPEMDGIETCYQLRKIPELSKTHVTFLTARTEEYVEVAGFEAGGNDFISKPIKPRALLARIKASLQQNLNISDNGLLYIHDLAINADEYSVKREGEEIPLSKLEFELLFYLASHSGKVFSRTQLLSKVWQNPMVMERTVDVHIRKLRQRLGEGYLETIKGVGYKFRA